MSASKLLGETFTFKDTGKIKVAGRDPAKLFEGIYTKDLYRINRSCIFVNTNRKNENGRIYSN